MKLRYKIAAAFAATLLAAGTVPVALAIDQAAPTTTVAEQPAAQPGSVLSVDVTPPATPAVYIAGDSIVASTVNIQWPARDGFTARLSARICGVYCGTPGHATVISVAHGGQRLTGGDPGSLLVQWPSILASTPHPDVIVVGIGINDMGLIDDNTWADAYRAIVFTALDQGVRVIPCLMAPVGSNRTDIEDQRARLNEWLINYWGASAVARFDWAEQLPSSPWLDPAYDSGDHLHPNRLGVVSLADSVPLARISGLPGAAMASAPLRARRVSPVGYGTPGGGYGRPSASRSHARPARRHDRTSPPSVGSGGGAGGSANGEVPPPAVVPAPAPAAASSATGPTSAAPVAVLPTTGGRPGLLLLGGGAATALGVIMVSSVVIADRHRRRTGRDPGRVSRKTA